jgi:putative chitinase
VSESVITRRLITLDQLMAGMDIPRARADWWDDPLNEAMVLWRIDTRLDMAAFLANVGHESGRLVYTREIWGPTRAQRKYEGRKDLGNTQPGDGKRYLGRGPIQLTGRANARKATVWIRKVVPGAPDFEASPELLELPRWGSLAAGAFWTWRDLSPLARAGRFNAVCNRVNGGWNGLLDRRRLYQSFLKVL